MPKLNRVLETACGFRRNPDRYSDLKSDSIPE